MLKNVILTPMKQRSQPGKRLFELVLTLLALVMLLPLAAIAAALTWIGLAVYSPQIPDDDRRAGCRRQA
jgi:lipopolysaccharide/colanic/teichoic acid biosynthesis glycosyltransferase